MSLGNHHDTGGLRPYSKPAALARLDRRTRESKLLEDVRRDLVRHVGGSPSATQRALIERACQLTLRVALMDRAFAETGELTDHTSRHYLAFSNSLNRTLRELGLKGAAERAPSLADYLRGPNKKRPELPSIPKPPRSPRRRP